MNGTLKVTCILPPYLVLFGPATWSTTGFPNQASGSTVSLPPGEYTITFSPVDTIAPVPVTVTIVSGQLTISAGSYAQAGPETLIESGCAGLEETPCYALNAEISTPLFFAASSIDAAFSGYAGIPDTNNAPGAAYTAAKVMGAHFNEGYQIMLEGGQEASDFISEAELTAIATTMAPYLTSAGMALPGGIPIRCGYILQTRKVGSWVIQRGKGFSVAPAIDGGFLTGVPSNLVMQSWVSIGSTAGPPVTVTGFAVAFNGTTWPDQAPAGYHGSPITGMPTPPVPGPVVQGYPAGGGSNISMPSAILGAISYNTVNDDDTINAALNCLQIGTAGGGLAYYSQFLSVFSTFQGTDWYNAFGYFSPTYYQGFPFWNGNITTNLQSMPPAYFVGSPNYYWAFTGIVDDPTSPDWILIFNGDNCEFNTMPAVMIFWIGLSPAQVPRLDFNSPNAMGKPGPTPNPPAFIPNPLTALYAVAPADRNTSIDTTSNGTVSPFAISLDEEQTTELYNLFNLQ